jgi:hypothetical protein
MVVASERPDARLARPDQIPILHAPVFVNDRFSYLETLPL